jgi:hypothetical protein
MTAVLGCTLALCVACVVVGRAVLRLSGCSTSDSAAPAVGFAVLVIVTDATFHLGGDGVAAAVVLAVVTCASLALELIRHAERPSLSMAVAAVLALAAGCLPFLASGRSGTLGVSLLNDLSIHEYWAWARDQGQVYHGLIYPGYPLGAHSLAGALSELTGTNVENGFAGLLIGVPALTALVAHAALAHVRAAVRALGSALAAFPYLAAAYLGEGSFKEPMVVLLVLGCSLMLRTFAHSTAVSSRQTTPLGLLIAACALIEGGPGLAWPFLTIAIWALVELARRRRHAAVIVRRAVRPGLIGLLVMLLAIAPALGELLRFAPNLQGSNLPGFLPFAESLGVWFETDFRLAHSQLFSTTLLAIIGIVIFAYAVWWWVRRRDEALPAAAVAGLIVYGYVQSRSNAYLTAKTQMIWAGLYMVVVVGALLDFGPPVVAWRLSPRSVGRIARIAVAAAFVLAAARSSALTLRYTPVDSDARINELAHVRALVAGQPTVLLVSADFGPWELRGAKQAVVTAYGIADQVPLAISPDRPAPVPGVTTDFATITPAGLDRFRYAITTSSAYAATAPPNWHLVLRTRSYQLWRRAGPSPAMAAPPGSTEPISRLNCSSSGTAAALTGALAQERTPPVIGAPASWREADDARPPVGVGFAAVASGSTVSQSLQLGAGNWDISVSYQSAVSVQLEAGRLQATLPADLDEFGPFWSAGVLHSLGGAVAVSIRLSARPFPGIQTPVSVGPVVATRVDVAPHLVPARRACGHFVDWLEKPAALGTG